MSSQEMIYNPDEADFFHKKQNQLYLYVNHKGYVYWNEMRKICDELILSLPEEKQIKYGHYPIYKLFFPLVYNGIIETSTDDKNIIMFAPAPEVPFFLKEKNDLEFMDHFNTNDASKIMNKSELQINASRILNRYPTLKEKIKTWGKPSYEQLNGIFIKRNLYNINLNPTYENLPNFCIFKKTNRMYEPDYIKLDNSIYEIPNIFDALNIARSFIRINKQETPFSYDKNSKKLKFDYYNEIPLIIYRALIMYDIDQLKNREIYRDDRNKISFTNIPMDAVENLQRIYSL